MLHRETEIIFFDAGETLIHPRPSFPDLFSSVCADFHLEVDFALLTGITRTLMAEVEGKQRKGFTFTNDSKVSRRFWLDFYSALVREMGYERMDGKLPQTLYRVFSEPSNYDAYHDVSETMQELRGRGLRLGLISNFEAWLGDLLEGLGLGKYFEVTIISGREKFEKPHPKIFELALERSGVSPHRTLHVGDSPISDFDGAREVGMQAVLLDRWGRFPLFEGIKVNDLREIPGLLS